MQYFIPGYLFIIIFRFFTNKKIEKSIILIISCVLSYVFLSLIKAYHEPTSLFITSAIAVIAAIVCGLIFSLIYISKWFSWILVHIFHKTVHDDIWHDVFDFKNGSNLKVYFKDKDYYVIGAYRVSEDKGNDSWFAISGYGKYNKITNDPIENGFIGDDSVIMTFKLSDVEHIEVF